MISFRFRPGPRTTVVFAALTIELCALGWWPAVHLLDVSESGSRMGQMVIQRYPLAAEVLDATKSLVDWLFPGALWAWDNLVAFMVHSFIVAFVVYAVAAWRLTRPPTLGLAWILVPLAAFQLTLLAVPASLTTDIFNYAIYGEMPVLYGANPFVRTPAEFPQSPLYYLIPLYWHDAPSVYGPFWVLLSAGVAAVSRPLPLVDELLAYRLIANAAHLANALLVWAIARRLDPDGSHAPSAALTYAWNPLLLLDFSLNGHNDVLMLTFTLIALWLASAGRLYSSGVALGLSVATKYTSILIAPIVFIQGVRHSASLSGLRARFVALIGATAILGATVVLLYAPWVEGIDTFGPVLYWASGPRLQNFWLEPTLISVTSWASGLLGVAYDDLWEPIVGGFKLVAKIAFVVYVLAEAWRARTFDDVLGGSARVMIVFLLVVNTWVMPWYYTWPLALAAPLGWTSMLVRVCAGLSLTAPIIMYQRQFQYGVLPEWAGLSLVLPLVIVGAVAGIGWINKRKQHWSPKASGTSVDAAPSPSLTMGPDQGSA